MRGAKKRYGVARPTHREQTSGEIATLYARMRAGGADGQRARDEMIEANLALVPWWLRSHPLALYHDFDDLVQEGYVGLIRAVDRFIPELGYRFSSYAWFWIHKAVARFARANRLVRISEHAWKAGVRGPVAETVANMDGLDWSCGLETADPDDPHEEVRALLEMLPPVERRVMERWLGLLGAPVSLARVGAEMRPDLRHPSAFACDARDRAAGRLRQAMRRARVRDLVESLQA